MKHIFITLFLVLFISCEKNKKEMSLYDFKNNCIDNNDAFKPVIIPQSDEYRMFFNRNSQIHIYSENDKIGNAATEPGTKIVFEYSYTYNDDPIIQDDEYMESIKFEIEPELDSFLISDDNLRSCNAVFGKFSFSPDWGYHYVTSGCIQGVKINQNEWQIDMNIKADAEYGDFEKMLSGRFFLE